MDHGLEADQRFKRINGLRIILGTGTFRMSPDTLSCADAPVTRGMLNTRQVIPTWKHELRISRPEFLARPARH